MRKLLLASLVLSYACLTAQNRFPAINLANSDPTGTGCTLPNGISQYSTNLYICSGGTWHAIAGSGGSGTVSGQTPAFLPLATASTTIGKASPLSVDDVNTPTKVTSSVGIEAPGATIGTTTKIGPDEGVNIKAYGATCDNVADDTAAFQAAVTALGVNAG